MTIGEMKDQVNSLSKFKLKNIVFIRLIEETRDIKFLIPVDQESFSRTDGTYTFALNVKDAEKNTICRLDTKEFIDSIDEAIKNGLPSTANFEVYHEDGYNFKTLGVTFRKKELIIMMSEKEGPIGGIKL